jgi:hypothetical protein
MGHRLITALTFLNALGVFACIMVIAAATNKAPEIAVPIVRAIRACLRMFVIGAALPTVAWGISAMEMNRSNARVKLIESWAMYLLLLASLVLFFVAAWRLPVCILDGLS